MFGTPDECGELVFPHPIITTALRADNPPPVLMRQIDEAADELCLMMLDIKNAVDTGTAAPVDI